MTDKTKPGLTTRFLSRLGKLRRITEKLDPIRKSMLEILRMGPGQAEAFSVDNVPKEVFDADAAAALMRLAELVKSGKLDDHMVLALQLLHETLRIYHNLEKELEWNDEILQVAHRASLTFATATLARGKENMTEMAAHYPGGMPRAVKEGLIEGSEVWTNLTKTLEASVTQKLANALVNLYMLRKEDLRRKYEEGGELGILLDIVSDPGSLVKASVVTGTQLLRALGRLGPDEQCDENCDDCPIPELFKLPLEECRAVRGEAGRAAEKGKPPNRPTRH